MENKIYKNFFDNTIEGILVIEDGFIIDINSSMLNILKYPLKNDLLGKLATGILIPNINQKYLDYNSGKYEEISLFTKDGKVIPAIIKIKDVYDNDKLYKMVFILDLSDLKQKENLLIEQSRMAAMGQMIAMIAHQWRQPLSSISTALTALKLRIKMKKYDEVVFENKFSDMENYLEYMSKTIDDFRHFFKENKTKELITINEIVKTALDMIENAFKIKNITIINESSKNSKIYILKNEFLQVILNILNNSKDAFNQKKSNKNQIIRISYEEDKNFQKIMISDNAGGIPEDIIAKIFDPYFSTKKEKNGTGLGLYMCKTILEKHCNAKIRAFNNKEGSSFEIKIHK